MKLERIKSKEAVNIITLLFSTVIITRNSHHFPRHLNTIAHHHLNHSQAVQRDANKLANPSMIFRDSFSSYRCLVDIS